MYVCVCQAGEAGGIMQWTGKNAKYHVMSCRIVEGESMSCWGEREYSEDKALRQTNKQRNEYKPSSAQST